MATTVSARIADKGWRRPWHERGSGTSARTLSREREVVIKWPSMPQKNPCPVYAHSPFLPRSIFKPPWLLPSAGAFSFKYCLVLCRYLQLSSQNDDCDEPRLLLTWQSGYFVCVPLPPAQQSLCSAGSRD